jgi:hypothetical protein
VTDQNSTMVEQNRRYGQLIARAWTDPEFKAQLLAEPATVAREAGLDVPDGMRLRAIDIAPAETYVVLTPPEQARDAAGSIPDVDDDEAKLFLTVLERAASDPAFKARLTSEPVTVLAEQGIVLPGTNRVVVVEPSDTEGYLFVPPVPEGLDIDSLDDTDGFFHAGDGGAKCSCIPCRHSGAAFSPFTHNPLFYHPVLGLTPFYTFGAVQVR